MLTIVWFRQDLRLADNPALAHAAGRGRVLPVFIDETDGRRRGAASRWWLHHSLTALCDRLGGLALPAGDPAAVLADLARRSGAGAVVWNRRYAPDAVRRDARVEDTLRAAGLQVRSFNASLLHEPWEVATGAGTPYKVFSAFWRAARRRPVAAPLREPDVAVAGGIDGDLAGRGLLPKAANWAAGWEDIWQPGEEGARRRFERFLEAGLDGYAALRDRPDLEHVSRLSPHLRFGEISPRQIWQDLQVRLAEDAGAGGDVEKYLSELGWREFAHHLLHHFPEITTRNLKPAFDAYPWRDSAADLERWQKGLTGYPFVDAAMRELWRTGYMHNRARMVAASFLVKHLRIHWRHGEAWFWDTLVDADPASNAAGWQWVAGSGADAAPYFRIFNPVAQGRKFDPDGAYVRRWCPELAGLSAAHIHAPFAAPAAVLSAAGITLGTTYPVPMIDHPSARRAALEGYEAIKARA